MNETAGRPGKLLLLTVLLVVACTTPSDGDATPVAASVEVLSVRPHDSDAWTQGLELIDGELFESTGQDPSALQRLDPETGTVLESVPVPSPLFAEGLTALGDDRLIQLTWRDEVARVYERESLELVNEWTYPTEGWGICSTAESLVMTDGTSQLYERDPTSFELIATITVTASGEPVDGLNELECVGNRVYANVWPTDQIVRFDRRTGAVDLVIDASGLLDTEAASTANVLNGIAYDRELGAFLVTGKLWPELFVVRWLDATTGEVVDP